MKYLLFWLLIGFVASFLMLLKVNGTVKERLQFSLAFSMLGPIAILLCRFMVKISHKCRKPV